jgi:hypothetical protein
MVIELIDLVRRRGQYVEKMEERGPGK